MKNFDIEVFIKDLDKLFNDMQDKAIAGSENVATASWVIKNQTKEIEELKHYIEGQNRKIIDLSFALEYAKRTDEFVKAQEK